jgi:hypothetical protein
MFAFPLATANPAQLPSGLVQPSMTAKIPTATSMLLSVSDWLSPRVAEAEHTNSYSRGLLFDLYQRRQCRFHANTMLSPLYSQTRRASGLGSEDSGSRR